MPEGGSTAVRVLRFPTGSAFDRPSDVHCGRSSAARYHVRGFPPRQQAGPMVFEAPPGNPRSDLLSAEATVDLLEQVKRGDRAALERLLRRCIQPLLRWARGRLPHRMRGMHDTADLVQDAVIAAVRRLDAFEARHQGALQAYLRLAVTNRIRDIIRQHKHRPPQTEIPE